MFSPSTYRDVPVLVLGGGGFIGSWTVRALHAAGADVTAVVRQDVPADMRSAAAFRDVRWITIDLTQSGAIAGVLQRCAPAVVMNLAGYGVDRTERDPHIMDALNVQIVRDLCVHLGDCADRGWRGARLVHVGSAAEYGPTSTPVRETTPANPANEYGRTKLAATEIVVQWTGADRRRAVIARPFTVYGAGEHSTRLLPAIMRAAREGSSVRLTSGRQQRCFTYVEDVAEGLLRLGADVAPGDPVVNLAADCVWSVREFAQTAADVIGLDRERLQFGALPDADDEMWHGEVDISRLRARTGWVPPTPLADGISRSLRVVQ